MLTSFVLDEDFLSFLDDLVFVLPLLEILVLELAANAALDSFGEGSTGAAAAAGRPPAGGTDATALVKDS